MQRARIFFGSGALVLGLLASCAPIVTVSKDDGGGEAGTPPLGSNGGSDVYGSGGSDVNGSGASPSGTGGSGSGGSDVNGSGGSYAAGRGGAAGGPGSGPSGPTDADYALNVDCDFIPLIQTTCATRGCHAAPTTVLPAAAGLNLSGDYVKTLKDVPATFGDIYCGDEPCDVPPASCPTAARLIDSRDWPKSRMWTTIVGNISGCGDQMPLGDYLESEEIVCFDFFVQAIAALP